MQDFLIQKLTALSDEERATLDAVTLGQMEAVGKEFEIKDTKLTRGGKEIIVLPHTRYTPTPTHRHNYVEIMIVLRGSVTHIIGENNVTLATGDMLFLNSHVSHAIRETGKGDLAVNIIMSRAFISALFPELCDTIFSDFIRETGREGGMGIYLHFKTGGNRQIENLTENILYELTEHQSNGAILSKTVSLLFHYLSLKCDELLCDSSISQNKENQRRMEILSYVNDNYRTARLTDLADKMGISAPYLSKIIGSSFQKSFKELLVERRIEKACELLTETSVPIGQIIRSLGYENESYFYREFKKRTGLSPSATRKQAHKSNSRAEAADRQ